MGPCWGSLWNEEPPPRREAQGEMNSVGSGGKPVRLLSLSYLPLQEHRGGSGGSAMPSQGCLTPRSCSLRLRVRLQPLWVPLPVGELFWAEAKEEPRALPWREFWRVGFLHTWTSLCALLTGKPWL